MAGKALAGLAIVEATTGDLDHALAHAMAIGGVDRRAVAIADAAAALAAQGRFDDAAVLALAAEREARSAGMVDRGDRQAEWFTALLVKTADLDLAERVARTITVVRRRDAALGAVVTARAKAGSPEQAATTAAAIEAKAVRAAAMAAVAEGWIDAGELERAAEVAAELTDSDVTARLTHAFAERGDLDRALATARSPREAWLRAPLLARLVTFARAAGARELVASLARSSTSAIRSRSRPTTRPGWGRYWKCSPRRPTSTTPSASPC